MTRPLWLASTLLSLAPTVLLAAEPPRQASGTFESRAWKLELVGAYAFPADDVGFDDEPGIKVVVSNRGFGTEWIDRYHDREHWIDDRFANDEDLVVYFHFDPKGVYKGLQYYFESGDGCGFCFDSRVISTVKVDKGRIGGKLTLPPKEGEIQFDFQFDVPIAPTDHGKPLPAGGGEIGQVYAAYHQALVDWKGDAVKGHLTADNAEAFAKNPENALKVWRDDHPTESYKIVKGWVKGDRALLLVEGATSYMKMTVEVLLDKENGAWKIADEIPKVKLGE